MKPILPEQLASSGLESGDFTPVWSKVISKSEAKKEGLRHYFTGKPCLHGHIDLKFVSSSHCIKCSRIKSAKYGKDNIAKIVARTRIKLYGITEKEFDELKKKQNNQCKLCNTNFKTTRATHVDHCHDTLKVRGLLCSNCNTALGLFKDDIKLLYRAIEYLNEADNS